MTPWPVSGEVAEPLELLNLPPDSIEPNPLQPRRNFSPETIESLARSIESQGVLQPLVVRSKPGDPNRYQLVAGERRLRAMRLLGLKAVPAVLREVPDENLLEAALVENIQREPLNPVEEAEAYRALLDRYGYTKEALAGRLGKDRSTIANMVRLLALPPLLKEDLAAGRLSAGHARALLNLPGADRQIALRGVVIERGLSVRETERMAARAKRENPAAPHGKFSGGTAGENPGGGNKAQDRARLQFDAVREMLEHRFSTRIRILPQESPSKNPELQGGRIELEYYSMEDFNRIYDLLTGRSENTDGANDP
ncbi:MAG: ParB/RepB/Spo0J family partition protein [SAR324 cluster bacterium]|nr:ParB/RepB/Spo0J family partition protein [SAR324 cluster bacterium]